MVTKARQLAEFIANADVDSDEIATGAVSASKLAATLDLSGKTIVLPDLNQGVTITSPSDAEGLKLNGRSADDIGQLKFYENDGTTSLARLDARTTHFEVGSYNELRISAGGVGNNHLIVDASGRVKIGTTSNTPASADEPGFVFGDNTAGTATAGVASFVANAAAPLLLTRRVSDGNVLGIADDTTTRGLLRVDGGDLNVSSNANLRLSAGGSSAKMTILSGGNVGIGTTSPAESLDIAGGSIRIGNSKIRHSGSGGSWDMAFETYSGGYFERMRIDSVGNVGVGTTSPDIYSFGGKILSVNGGTSYTNLVLAGDTNTGIAFGTSSARLGQITMDSTNGLTLYSQGTGNGQTMTLDRSGDVGIGTTSPATKLHVHSSGSPEIRATTGLDSNTPTMQIGYSSGSGYFLRLGDAANNEDIMLRTYGNSVFNGGNVGIGTSSPSYKLQVGNGSGTSPHVFLDGNFGTTNVADHARIYFNDPNFGIGAGGNGTTNDDDLYIWAYNGAGRDIRFAATTDGASAVNSGSWTTNVIIKNDGKVGIGTTTPTSKLELPANDNSATTTHLGLSGYAGINLTIPNTVGRVNQIVWTNEAATSHGYGSIAMEMMSGSGVGTGDMIFSTKQVGTNAASSEAMRIDSAGRVTMPYQPGFKAGLSSNATVSTLSAIVFNTTSGDGRYNTGGHYSTSNGRFTAPVAGAYHFDVGLLYGPSVPNGTNFDDAAFLYLNGAIAAYDERRAEYVDGTTGNGGYYGTWIHTQLYMNSGDYVEVINYNRFSGIHGNSKFTWFAGFLIG